MSQIEDCVSFLASKASLQISRRARELLAPYGVTPGQYAVLNVLSEGGGVSGAELGSRLVLDSASITGVVDRLEALGLLERRPDESDRRVQRLWVTPKAARQQPDLEQAMDQLQAEVQEIAGPAHGDLIAGLRAIRQQENWTENV